MEISESTKFVFYVGRIFGLSPYTIVRKNGRLYAHSKSLCFSIYSAMLITTVVFFTIRGIFYTDGTSARNIHTTKSPVAQFVTFMDVTIVVSASVSGFLCGIAGLKYTQELNHRLMKSDANIAFYQKVNETKDKFQSILLFWLVAFITLLTIGLDLWAWYRQTPKAKNPLDDKIIAYIPFYVLYLIGFTLLIIFSGTVLGIFRRFKRINEILRQLHENAQFKMLAGNGRKTPIIQIHLAPSESITSINHQPEDYFGPPVDNNNSKTGSVVKVMTGDAESINYDLLLRRLAYSHSSLSKAVVIVSKTFGLALLAVLTSCLLQLVGTSYYFLIEITWKKDVFSFFLQLLWLFVHLLRLLLTIEPCHITKEEASKTVIIVCDLMRNVRDPALQETLKMFWSQLIAHDVVFSACGMCKISRKILTSFCGSIATYLVILMQFQSNIH